MVKKIPLTQGKFALVDDDDYEWLNKYKWFAKEDCHTFYVCRNGSRLKKPRPYYRMHRCILKAKKDELVDHINGDGLDNRRSNLRIVTRRQNNQNKRYRISSKFPGVHWIKTENKWRTGISINGNFVSLGTFDNENKAFKAYKKAVHDLGEKLVCEL